MCVPRGTYMKRNKVLTRIEVELKRGCGKKGANDHFTGLGVSDALTSAS